MTEIRPLRATELDLWLDFVHGVFGTPREYFARHWHNDPWRSLEGIRVVMDGERIVSTLRIFTRQIYLGGEAVTMGGIGEVATDPAYRGQGLSGALLQDALVVMAEAGMAVSLLMTDQYGHYGRYGWQMVPVPIVVTEVLPAASTRCAVSRLDAADRAAMTAAAALHAAYAPRFDGPVVRSHPDYWHAWLAAEWRESWTAYRDGRLVGYLCGHWSGSAEFHVTDCAQDPAEAILLEILGHMAHEQGQGVLRVRLPVALAPSLPHLEQTTDSWAMYRVIRPDLLGPAATAAMSRLLAGDVSHHVWFGPDGF